MSKIVKKYTDPENPGSFSGLSGFHRNNKDFKINKIKKTLSRYKAYSLHKSRFRKFKRSRVLVKGIDDQWQIDLVDVKALKGSNHGKTFIFTCIDSFSKFAWAIALKDKEAKSCRTAFEDILKISKRKPNYIYSDAGKEFQGVFRKFCALNKISIILTKSSLKASIIERFNRTLKEKMWRMFSYNAETKKKFPQNYTNNLDKLVSSYNNTYHRSIKAKPIEVNKKNETIIYKNLYGIDDSIAIFIFNIGDYVRISSEKKIFSKGYTPNWSSDIYIIANIIPQDPPKYLIKDIEGQEYLYKFYSQELQKVNFDEFPYDSFKVLDETPENLLIEKLNSDRKKDWINKKSLNF